MVAKTKSRKPMSTRPQLPKPLVNDSPRLFTEADFPVGTASYQGDLMLVRIDKLPASAKPRASRQLAVGTTMGSRHVMTRGQVFDCDPGDDCIAAIEAATRITVEAYLVGPVFVSPDHPAATDLDHPEHGPQGFPAGSVIAVVYQRNLDAEERARRTVD